MTKLLRVSDRHQITLPASVMKDAGVAEGSYVAVEARGGKIILEPKKLASDDLTGEDWSGMDRLVKRQVRSGAFREFPTPSQAKKHLK